KDDVRLNIGRTLGVQEGDIYALIRPAPEGATGNTLQLGRRLSGICLVYEARDTDALCNIWRGSVLHPQVQSPSEGDLAIFLEHTFGAPPRQGLMQVGALEGGTQEQSKAAQDAVLRALNQYMSTHGASRVTVEATAFAADATSPVFYQAEREVAYRSMPQIFVGLSLREVDGDPHVIATYTGIGPSTGPGMIAAPPERGVDLGELDDLAEADLRGFMGVVWAGMLVYRGQTSEALMHLRQLLEDKQLTGPLRWHARDQYAMRWGALGYLDEALWLVLEDERVAREDEDLQAELNALGTRVRLYDMLERPPAAVACAQRYLELREGDEASDRSSVLGAKSMYAEMLMRANELEQGRAVVAELESACPDGCSGDLYSYLSGIYWALPPEDRGMQDQLLARLAELARSEDASPSTLASLRIYQGLQELKNQQFESALVAFLEAARLYEERKSQPGIARAKYFGFLSLLAMNEPLRAYDAAREVLELSQTMRDYSTATRIYDRLNQVYLDIDPQKTPRAYVLVANRVLREVHESQMANGDLAKASETLFALGNFYYRVGRAGEAQAALRLSIVSAIRTTRFDMAALAHLTRALIARSEGDENTYVDELGRARVMGKLSGDPDVSAAIERAVEGRPEPEGDPGVDTQLL
ncbi:MAG: hypothetical protein AAGI01_05070, partial [Myxococcota bacterium]